MRRGPLHMNYISVCASVNKFDITFLFYSHGAPYTTYPLTGQQLIRILPLERELESRLKGAFHCPPVNEYYTTRLRVRKT